MSKENDRDAKVKNDVSYEHKSYTAWHIFLADVLDYLFDPEDLEIYPFVKLGTLPLESDFIIIRKAGSEEELMSHYPDFVFLIPDLGEITVIEYKSPLDKVEKNDFDTLRIYRLLTKKKYMVDEDYRVRGITLASHFESGYKQHIGRNGYRFEELRKGIYGHEGDHQRYYWMDLAIIGQEDPENPINRDGSLNCDL